MGRAFERPRREWPQPKVSARSAQPVLSAGHSSDTGRSNVSSGGETSDDHLVQGREYTEDGQKV